MRNILSLALALGLALMVVGCKKDLTGDIERLAERACECADADCARTVLADLVKLAKDNPNPKGDQAKVSTAARKMGACITERGVPLSELASAMGELQK